MAPRRIGETVATLLAVFTVTSGVAPGAGVPEDVELGAGVGDPAAECVAAGVGVGVAETECVAAGVGVDEALEPGTGVELAPGAGARSTDGGAGLELPPPPHAAKHAPAHNARNHAERKPGSLITPAFESPSTGFLERKRDAHPGIRAQGMISRNFA